MEKIKDKVFNEILKEVRQTYKKDPRVVEYIVRHLCRSVASYIRDPLEERPIRLKYFGVFSLKKGAKKR